MSESNISVNFVKENENIYLSSIDENGNTIDYVHEDPLLIISPDGKYTKVEGVDLNNILKKPMEEPIISSDDVNDEIDFSNIEKEKDEELDIAVEQAAEAEEDEEKQDEVKKVVLEAKIIAIESKEKAEEALQTVQNSGSETAISLATQAKETAETAIALANTAEENIYNNISEAENQSIEAQETARKAIELATNAKEEGTKSFGEFREGGKKKSRNTKTKKSTKAGKKKTKRVRFVITKKGRKNKKNRTRR